jgi:type I restriction enzyme S subunit
MSEWIASPFKNYFEVGLRNGLTKPSRIRGHGLPMVNMKEIFGYDVITDKTPMELVPVSDKELESSLLQYDDLLFARQSLTEEGAGKISIYKGKSPTVFESHLIRCRIDKDKADPNFIYYLFKSPYGKGTVSTIVQQVAAAGIKGSDLQELEFTFPPLQEQKAIANVLTSLDDKIDLLHRQNKTLESMAETLFRQWFIEEAKEDWAFVELGQYVNCFNGASYKSDDLNSSSVAMVTLKSFERDGGFRLDGFKEFTGKFKDQHIVEQGDLVVAHTDITQDAAVIGNPVLVVSDTRYEKLVISMDLVKVASKYEWLSNEFLYRMMRTREFKQHCLGFSNGSTVLHLSKDAIPSYEFFLPPIEKIVDFTNTAKGILNKKFKNISQIRTLETLRDTLLPKLMSGEVRVKI